VIAESPPSGSAEAAALAYLTSTSLAAKLTAPPRGLPFSGWRQAAPATLRPGRPPELTVVDSAPKTPRSLSRVEARTQLVHTFLHHELQAAELFCWAALRFPDTPEDFRRGLFALCRDEVRHMGLYRDYLADHGVAVGDHPVRDWFWQRVPHCATPRAFVATLGIGFEGGNLDHTQRFAQMFRAAGDDRGAALQEKVGREEVAHVRFAWRWFDAFSERTEEDRFAAWAAALPKPLSPMLMKGKALHRGARRRAGLDDAFLDKLAAYRGH
jgi:uncharacterized ferritin-like protein (DUF455 family)